jgi:hypothetical protein
VIFYNMGFRLVSFRNPVIVVQGDSLNRSDIKTTIRYMVHHYKIAAFPSRRGKSRATLCMFSKNRIEYISLQPPSCKISIKFYMVICCIMITTESI